MPKGAPRKKKPAWAVSYEADWGSLPSTGHKEFREDHRNQPVKFGPKSCSTQAKGPNLCELSSSLYSRR